MAGGGGGGVDPGRRRAAAALTHVDEATGDCNMVDVGGKEDTKRVATARAFVVLEPHVYDLVAQDKVKKGNVLAVAQIAGIQAAKKTSDLIPLCHNLALDKVGRPPHPRSPPLTIADEPAFSDRFFPGERGLHPPALFEQRGDHLERQDDGKDGGGDGGSDRLLCRRAHNLRHVQGCLQGHAHHGHLPPDQVGREVRRVLGDRGGFAVLKVGEGPTYQVSATNR